MGDPNAERTLRIKGRAGPTDPDSLAWMDARKRPVVVEAANIGAPFEVETMEGTMQGDADDVLIRGVEGELYPCDADVFAETYDLVDDVEEEEPPTEPPTIYLEPLVDVAATLVGAYVFARALASGARAGWSR